MPTAMISGGFDPVTVGHLNLIISAFRFGRVTIALNSDAWLVRKKGFVFMPWGDRARILREIRRVAKVVPVKDDDGTVGDALRRFRPDYFCNGGDRAEPNPVEDAACRELGIEQVFNVGGGKTRSSSGLIARAREMVSR